MADEVAYSLNTRWMTEMYESGHGSFLTGRQHLQMAAILRGKAGQPGHPAQDQAEQMARRHEMMADIREKQQTGELGRGIQFNGVYIFDALDHAIMEDSDRHHGVLDARRKEIGLIDGWDYPSGEPEKFIDFD